MKEKIKISECPYYKNGSECMNKHARKLFGKKCHRKSPLKCPIYIDFIERLESMPKQENIAQNPLKWLLGLFKTKSQIKEHIGEVKNES